MISLSIDFLRVPVKTTVLCSTFALWPAEVLLHTFCIKPFPWETTVSLYMIYLVKIWRLINASATTCHGQMASLGAIWQISVAFNQTSDLVVQHWYVGRLSDFTQGRGEVAGYYPPLTSGKGRDATCMGHQFITGSDTRRQTHAHTSRPRESSANLQEYPRESRQIRKHTNKQTHK